MSSSLNAFPKQYEYSDSLLDPKVSVSDLIHAYQCGDDSFFIKAIEAPSPACDTNDFSIDLAIIGKSKSDLPYRNILTNQYGVDTIVFKALLHPFDNQKVILGVADGVGGWWAHGIDPGIYSSELIKHTALSNTQSPEEMIWDGYSKTSKIASSTICVAAIDKADLTWSNVGDSGLRVIRKSNFVVKTQEQQHKFNKPYQLGNSCDTPDLSDCGKHLLKKGDILIMATDGLFDNLDNQELIEVINHHDSAKEIANNVFNQALKNSTNKKKESLFVQKAIASGVSKYRSKGGKPDDISIIVVVVN